MSNEKLVADLRARAVRLRFESLNWTADLVEKSADEIEELELRLHDVKARLLQYELADSQKPRF